jgi:hypothetical protein
MRLLKIGEKNGDFDLKKTKKSSQHYTERKMFKFSINLKSEITWDVGCGGERHDGPCRKCYRWPISFRVQNLHELR